MLRPYERGRSKKEEWGGRGPGVVQGKRRWRSSLLRERKGQSQCRKGSGKKTRAWLDAKVFKSKACSEQESILSGHRREDFYRKTKATEASACVLRKGSSLTV